VSRRHLFAAGNSSLQVCISTPCCRPASSLQQGEVFGVPSTASPLTRVTSPRPHDAGLRPTLRKRPGRTVIGEGAPSPLAIERGRQLRRRFSPSRCFSVSSGRHTRESFRQSEMVVSDLHECSPINRKLRPLRFKTGYSTHNAAQAEYDRSAALVFPWSGAEIPATYHSKRCATIV
jgi:hypothetical protein